MRVLLDTNILIHREARTVVRDDIGTLFRWLDRVRADKCVHPASLAEIRKHGDAEVVRTLEVKDSSYRVLQPVAPPIPLIAAIGQSDVTDNDRIDTALLAEVLGGRVDALITEDRGIHRKADTLKIGTRVFTIDAFLEKLIGENPELAEYRVLAVRKTLFGHLDLHDSFFDSFREDYPGFDAWFNRKAEETAYVCTGDEGQLVAFLYLKQEGAEENYSDVTPQFRPRRRLKIGTFKVVANGYKIGERFLKIVFDNALLFAVDEIYVTIFDRRPDQRRLIALLHDWGFRDYGIKRSGAGDELVLCRDFQPRANVDDPRLTYPYFSASTQKFIVPIWPDYHTDLLPDSILRTESPSDFVEQKPNRNAISKVYISRSIERNLNCGDVIVFYRTGSGIAPAHHTAVATTIGIVQSVHSKIGTEEEFLRLCRKRSVFTDDELRKWWNWKPTNRPFVVNFLYAHSLPKRPNLATLKKEHVITQHPRGFELLTDEGFDTLLSISNANQRLVVR